MTWISVKDKLPPKNHLVCVYWRDREVLIGYHMHNENEYEPTEGWVSISDEKSRWANFWMPLEKPEPPEVKNE